MIKKITLLPLLFLFLVGVTGCEFSRTDEIHGNSIPPEYVVSEEDFKTQILSIAQVEEILISTSITTRNGVRDNSISIELKNPQSSPDNKIKLSVQSNKIITKAKESIKNIKDYDKIIVNYSEEKIVDGLKKLTFFKTKRIL